MNVLFFSLEEKSNWHEFGQWLPFKATCRPELLEHDLDTLTGQNLKKKEKEVKKKVRCRRKSTILFVANKLIATPAFNAQDDSQSNPSDKW
jgi:hypothetical protein